MSNSVSENRPLPRHPRVLWSRLSYRWPFLVWLIAVGVGVWFYIDTGRTIEISGVIEVVREEIAPIETARLLKLNVVEGQQVKAGEIIAELDTTLVDAEIADLKAERAADPLEIAAQMAELKVRFEIDQVQMERQFASVISAAELRLRDLRFQQAVDSNRLDVLRNQIKQLLPVMSAATTDAKDLINLRAEEENLVRSLRLYEESIKLADTDIVHAREQREAARTWKLQESAVTNAIAAQDRFLAGRELLEALKARKAAYVLKASNDGTVSRVARRPGDMVTAASPVVTIVVNGSQHVIAFVPEALARTVGAGTKTWVARPLQSKVGFDATVKAMGPEVMSLPTRLSPIPGQTVRGRRAIITIDQANDFMPGEAAHIFLGKPWWFDYANQLRERFKK